MICNADSDTDFSTSLLLFRHGKWAFTMNACVQLLKDSSIQH